MAIFRKRVIRSSTVTIAIEADSKEEADLIYGDWLDEGNDENYEELSQMLNERSTDSDEWLVGFSNVEAYNRAPGLDDFVIFKSDTKKDLEPKYDIWLRYEDHDNRFACYGKNRTMADVINDLRLLNDLYYVKPACYLPKYDEISSARNRGTHILAYDLERRKNGCQK